MRNSVVWQRLQRAVVVPRVGSLVPVVEADTGNSHLLEAALEETDAMNRGHSEITYDELSTKLKDVTVIDVRNRIEMEQNGQIPGSHCIPVTEIKYACTMDENAFKNRYGFEKPGPDDPLVVCCKTGVRSKTACDLLQANGFKRHRIYRGSFSEWEEKGGEVIKPGQPIFYDSDDDDDSS